jgi:N-(2-amino-2-carboxyethyl)-L-glutamate synthase
MKAPLSQPPGTGVGQFLYLPGLGEPRPPVRENVLSTIGDTPLVRLKRLFPDPGPQVFAKLEAFNPGGSIKDRPALHIVEESLRSGLLNHNSVIVESSSGNMGIGLAQACRYYGLRFICVVDPKASTQNLKILRAYGAEIDLVAEPDPETGEFLPARFKRVRTLLQQVENSFWPNQYENTNNPRTHYLTTMHEIVTALNGRLDYLFVGTSTCGTIRGCAEYVRDHALLTQVVAVDAVGSLIFSDVREKRLLPGLGAGLKPPFCDTALIDRYVHVSDLECVVGCRRLVIREAFLAGGSSGGVISAMERLRPELPPQAVCAVILPDRGERYLDTVYDDVWVREHFGDIFNAWN